jgi:hypothetical protein
MAGTRWTWKQAVQYVLAHRPCEDERIADALLRWYAPSIPMWWRLHAHHSTMVPIDGREWMIDCDIGQGRFAQHLFQTHGNGEVVLEAATVERLLCARQPEPKGPGGRPPKPAWDLFYGWIIHLAERPDGLPDDPAELKRIMLDWCEENIPDQLSETSIREKIKMIYELRKALADNSR